MTEQLTQTPIHYTEWFSEWKNAINLISVLTIWWCPCVESFLVLLRKVFSMISTFSWQNSISLCPASFCTPRLNLCISRYLLTPYFCIPFSYDVKGIFFVVSLEGLTVKGYGCEPWAILGFMTSRGEDFNRGQRRGLINGSFHVIKFY